MSGLKTAQAFIGVTILVVVVANALIAYGSWWPFEEVFGFGLIFGSVIVMYSGAMASAGGSEAGAVPAAHMMGEYKAKYYEQYGQERQSRRDEQFWYMLLMVIAGLMLMGMGFRVLG